MSCTIVVDRDYTGQLQELILLVCSYVTYPVACMVLT